MMRKNSRDFGSARRFLTGEAGGVLIYSAFAAVALFGVAAMSLDAGYAYLTKNRLQVAADAAALAAVTALPDEAEATTRALAVAAANMPTAQHGTVLATADITFGSWNSSTRTFTAGTSPATAVRVVTRRAGANSNALGLYLANIWGIASMDVVASAVATERGATCVLALDPTASGAVTLLSNSELTIQNCGLHVNSNNATALITDSNGELNAESINIKGGYSELGNSAINPDPHTNVDPLPDPLSALGEPSSSPCTFATRQVFDNAVTTIPAGVYCGGIEIKNNSNVTMSAGTVVIKDGSLFVDSNSRLTANNVTVFLTGSSGLIDFDSNSQVQITAPTTGPYAGVAIYQDRDFGGIHHFDSNNNTSITGLVYTPAGQINVDSNSAIGMAGCVFFIGKTFRFDSNGGFLINFNRAACAGMPIPVDLKGAVTRLVQ